MRFRARNSAGNKVVLHKQVLNSRAQESLDRFFGRVYDRLSFHIEAGVQHHFAACGLADCLQQGVEIRIVVRRNRLKTCRSVDVRYCGQLCAVLWSNIYDGNHVRKLSTGSDFKPTVGLLERAGWSEG